MKKLFAILLFAVGAASVLIPSASLATTNSQLYFQFRLADAAKDCRDRGGVPTSGVLEVPSLGITGTKCIGGEDSKGYQNPIFALVSIIIQIAISFMGLAMVGLLVFAGIRYITSAGNPDDVKAAKGMINSVLTALILFFVMGAVLTLILPPGYNIFR